MVRNILAGLLVLLTSIACFGQTPLHGLIAGQSVRTDVERTAGKPVQVHSQTLVEYHPYDFNPKVWNRNVAKMYVQYRTDSPIVERIEAMLAKPISRAVAFKNLNDAAAGAKQPNLPDQPTARGRNGERLVEYFGAPHYVVFTYQGADVNSAVARTARYSPELFESTVRSLASASGAPSPPGSVPGTQASTAGPTTPSLGPRAPGPSPGGSAAAPAPAVQPGDFVVRLLTPIDTRTSKKGDKVTAQVISPQQFSGDTLEGSVKNSKSGSKIKGTSVLNFSFDTLNHGGQAIPVQASVKSVTNSQGKVGVDEEGQIVRKKNSLGTLAAGTALGALVGGLAGGGKGAAIGAGVGAAAALVLVEVATEGPNVSFAPGSEFVVNLKRRS